jgi:hypothetical protein
MFFFHKVFEDNVLWVLIVCRWSVFHDYATRISPFPTEGQATGGVANQGVVDETLVETHLETVSCRRRERPAAPLR